MSLAVFKLLDPIWDVQVCKPSSPHDPLIKGVSMIKVNGKVKESAVRLLADRLAMIKTGDGKFFIIMDDGIIPIGGFKSNSDQSVFDYFATATSGLVAMDDQDKLTQELQDRIAKAKEQADKEEDVW